MFSAKETRSNQKSMNTDNNNTNGIHRFSKMQNSYIKLILKLNIFSEKK